MRRNRFEKGSGCFVCSCCKKKTRSTGRGDNENVGLCADCYDKAGDDNAVADGQMSEEEFQEIWHQPSSWNKETGDTHEAKEK